MWLGLFLVSAPMAIAVGTNGKMGVPLTSGSHPLHQYHAWLGAKGLLERGNPSVFDPAFHAGYIKTPLFDSQSISIEWMAALIGLISGNGVPPTLDAIKVMHAWYLGLLALGIPFMVALGARFAGMTRIEALASGAITELVLVMPVGTCAMVEGDLCHLLAPACCALFIGSLVGYHRRPKVAACAGVFISFWMLWSTSVGTALLATGMLLYYYLRAGLKHESWWHFGLATSLLAALAGNAGLFLAWRDHWWIQATMLDESPFGPGGALERAAHDERWGGPPGLMAGMLLVGLSLAGTQWLVWSGRRLAGRMIATVTVVMVLAFILGKTGHLLAPLEGVANPVAVLVLGSLGAGATIGMGRTGLRNWKGPEWLRKFPGRQVVAACFAVGFLSLAAINPSFGKEMFRNWLSGSGQFEGPPPWGMEIADCLAGIPNTNGRVLWEDLPSDSANGWAVFLPQMTGHGFIGGLAPSARIEHQQASLRDGKLAGRSILDWSDSELAAFIKAYRVSVVVARMPDSISRLSRFPEAVMAKTGSTGVPEGQWVAFRLPDQPGLAVVGNAKVVHMGSDKVTLADVVPENGSVVLSLHFQRGMKVRPGRVRIERELDSHDPIPLVRLKTDEPVSRLELEWDDR